MYFTAKPEVITSPVPVHAIACVLSIAWLVLGKVPAPASFVKQRKS